MTTDREITLAPIAPAMEVTFTFDEKSACLLHRVSCGVSVCG